MSLKIITSLLKGVEIPSRLFKVISWYLLSLMVPADKHSLTFAQKLSGKANSLFSNLLSRHLPISKMVLNRLARRQIASRMKKRKLLVPDCQWTVAIIIDSTLHERSSEKIENSQKFNHGQGWVVGHQWTNIGILINGQYIPLPPIPFFTQDECKRRNIHYRTEHEKIANFLKTLDLNELLGPHQISELVVLADAGYDSKVIQKSLLMRKIDYVFSIKESRVITVKDSKEIKISDYFRDGRRPWKTTRIKSSGGKSKWRRYAIKHVEGYLKAGHSTISLVCSKRSDGKIKYLSCSNCSINPRTIMMTYQLRWHIETFHRSVKSYLGMEDGALQRFDALNAHVNWVYCAFILLNDFCNDHTVGIKSKQEMISADLEKERIGTIKMKNYQIGGQKQIRLYCSSVSERLEKLHPRSAKGVGK